MRRADAFALVRTHGGKPREGVTKHTDVLIVGELGWPLLDDGRPSNSLARAKSYRVLIASERQFLGWLGKRAPEEHAKTYSAEQLASLSKLPKEIVDQLSMFGLIESRNGLYGFRDLAAARQVAGLLAAGTALSVITKSLCEIRKWLPDARLSNLKLFPESSDRILVEQMKGRTDKTGQFVMDVEKPADNADAVFEEAQAAEEKQRHRNGRTALSARDEDGSHGSGRAVQPRECAAFERARPRSGGRLSGSRQGRSEFRIGLVQPRRRPRRTAPHR